MRGFGLVAGLFVLFAGAALADGATPDAIHRAEHATALVRISQDGKTIGYGSAFCYDDKGLFITNCHVANGKTTVELVIDPSEKTQHIVKAKVLRADAALDLAELQADGGGPFTPLMLGNADGLVETQDIVAFGYPFGAGLSLDRGGFPSVSVNTGHITSLRKKNGQLELIQVDALVNPGNSGGPVIDSDGKVVAIVEAGIPGAGLNFAIPISRLDKLLKQPLGHPVANVGEPGAPVVHGVQQPIPAAADQKKAEKTIEDAYKTELSRPKQADQLDLAKTLISTSGDMANTAAERYMMLVKARQIAARAGDLEIADAACSELSNNFDISLGAARLAMLQEAAPSLLGQDQNAAFVITSLHTIDDALNADDFAPVEDVLKLATVALHNTGSADLGEAIAARRSQLASQQRQFEVVKPQMKILAEHPDDPGANLAVGKYDCFYRGDWDTGLPLLAKGNDAHLQHAAQLDLSDPEQPDAQAAIGDEWYQVANLDQIRLRAYFWYLKARPGLSGPAAHHVEAHIDELQSVASRRWGHADLWLAVHNVLRNKSYEVSKTVGGGFSHDEFQEVPAAGGILIGLRVGFDEFVGNRTIGFFQGIYLTPDGEKLGRPIGTLKGEPAILKAKPGYAVGAVTAHGGGGMDSFIVTFMKITGTHLDPATAYTSEKAGGSGGGEAIFNGKGVPIIGLCGRIDASGKYPGFGVVYMDPIDPPANQNRRLRFDN